MSLGDDYSITNVRLQRKSQLAFIKSEDCAKHVRILLTLHVAHHIANFSMSFCKRFAAKCTCLPEACNAVSQRTGIVSFVCTSVLVCH